MSANSKIEWCDHTFNPWEGCQKVGPGCDHCYAEARNARFGGGVAVNWGPGAPRRRTSPANWQQPLAWDKAHTAFFARHGRRQRVFCASLADVFDNEVPREWRYDLLWLISNTPHLDWLLLTKRIGNASAMLASECARMGWPEGTRYWSNLWLGATVVNQEEADRDIPKLLAVPAAKRFLSMEPLLGPVDLDPLWLRPSPSTAFVTGKVTWDMPAWTRFGCIGLDWVIVGGESGPGARPMHPDWARSLRDQCAAAGVPFFFKQWGEHMPAYDRGGDDPDYWKCAEWARKPGRWINHAGGHGFNGERVHFAHRVGKKAAGRLLDGVEHNGFPEAT